MLKISTFPPPTEEEEEFLHAWAAKVSKPGKKARKDRHSISETNRANLRRKAYKA